MNTKTATGILPAREGHHSGNPAAHLLPTDVVRIPAADVNREVNNGRGPVDFKVSKGALDRTLIEFKLASNKKLKQNLEKQVEIYQKANKKANAMTTITFFTESTGEGLPTAFFASSNGRMTPTSS